MVSSSQAEPQLRPRASLPWIPRRLRMRRLRRTLGGWRATTCRAIERGLHNGVSPGMSVRLQKRLWLSNTCAIGGTIIMAGWAALEALFGDSAALPWEIGFTTGFLGVLALNARGAHRAGRLLLVVSANLCVFAGAILFSDSAGGTLPFFAMAAIPLLLFGPGEWLLATLGAALPLLLFALCESGIAAQLLVINPQPAPAWYFAANTATTFALAFLVPYFLFRSNVRAEAALERSGQEKLKRLLDADLIGVVRGRLSGRIEDANDTFLSLLGYTRADLAAGALDLKLIAPLDPFQMESPRHGPTSVYELCCRRKDGKLVPVLVGVALLDESNDEVVGFVLDLTAQKSVEAQRTMLHDSREALRLRDLFNSIASHELKTPLTALLLSLQLLSHKLDREAPGNASLRTQVARCETAATRMGDLIDALLDVAYIHRGRLTLNVHEMDVVEAVRRVASGFEMSRNNGGACRISVCAEGSVTARLDSVRFDQIVSNLISNAVKYGAGKPIEIRVRHDDSENIAHIEVIDRGPGIDPCMKEKIFEPFQRATSMEPVPGLGLGLYVVKLIVDGHGGRVAVDSKLGHGSRFIVDLPCAGVSPTQPLLH
jgi:PAS domain S-box-containing protein